MQGLDITKIIKDNDNTIVSTKEALKDVTPMEWPEEVLSGQKKVVITDVDISENCNICYEYIW